MEANEFHRMIDQAFQHKRYDEVLEHYDAALGAGVFDQRLQNLAALAYFRTGRKARAIQLVENALKTSPDSPALNNNAGNFYRLTGHWSKAKVYLQKAYQALPTNSAIATNLAGVHAHLGEQEDAERIMLHLVRAKPNDVALYEQLFAIYSQYGNEEGAKSALNEILRREPNNAKAYYRWVVVNNSRSFDKALLKSIENLLKSPVLGSEDQAHLYFALAEIYRNSDEHEDAFQYYRMANSAALADFDADRFAERQRQVFDLVSGTAEPAADGQPARPVFVVGMPRSGTSLTEQMLDSHPEAFGLGELNVMHELVEELLQQDTPSEQWQDAEYREGLRRRYLDHVPGEAENCRVFVDKAPMNFQYLGLIRQLFPDAKFVYCRRHPVDTILSCYMQNFHRQLTFAFDLDDLCYVYLQSLRIMERWQADHGDAILELRYEGLVDDPAAQARRLLEHCGLEWSEVVLNPERNPRPVNTASGWQVKRPIYSSAVGRWEHYRPYLGRVLERLSHEKVPFE